MTGLVLGIVVVVGGLVCLAGVRLASRRQAKQLEVADLLWVAADRLREELGRSPTQEEVVAAAGFVRVHRSLRFWEEAVVPGRARLEARAAERKLMLALSFLPSEQRVRYWREWNAEMATLNPQDAAAFAFQILRSAPLMGLTLMFVKVFDRRAA
ncbi:hypothetical protein ACFQ9Q_33315 [Streptomyces virginiae]|uniref:hypothetical protein n=1 Tax=Streptomyces virginiae TaxID=1961 RepID=UPI0036862A39